MTLSAENTTKWEWTFLSLLAFMLQFRAEFFSIFNRPTFETPGATLGAGKLWRFDSTQPTERQIRFGLRFMFGLRDAPSFREPPPTAGLIATKEDLTIR